MRLVCSALLIYFGCGLADATGMFQIPLYLEWTMAAVGFAMIGGGIYLWRTSSRRDARKKSAAGNE